MTLTLVENQNHAGLLHKNQNIDVVKKAVERNGNEGVFVAFLEAERFRWEERTDGVSWEEFE